MKKYLAKFLVNYLKDDILNELNVDGTYRKIRKYSIVTGKENKFKKLYNILENTKITSYRLSVYNIDENDITSIDHIDDKSLPEFLSKSKKILNDPIYKNSKLIDSVYINIHYEYKNNKDSMSTSLIPLDGIYPDELHKVEDTIKNIFKDFPHLLII